MELCADNALHFQNCIPILCHLRKIVIHSFLPSKNVLRSLMCQAILDSSDVSPFIPKLLYADTLQGVTTLTLADHLQIRIICQKLQFLE